MMKLGDFDYRFPADLIAQYPLEQRDEARLLVVDRKTGRLHHDRFLSLKKYLPKESTLVVNDSKVIPARLWGRREKTGGKVEVFLLNRLSDGCSYEALIRPLKRLNTGEKIYFNGQKIYCELRDPQKKIVKFNKKNILNDLEKIGHIPLPPYIKRMDEPSDREFYQTIYARRPGSVASPTAGLHFTKPLLAGLRKDGHAIERLTLHVNYATFKPVTEEDMTRHQMHNESYEVSGALWQRLNKNKLSGRKIVAVGTTACRTLETVAQSSNLKGKTNLFITPGFSFQMTDCLITNFHVPKSTLFMLVCAFASRDLMRHAYRQAIRLKYRFFSYGDGMLIL